MGTKYRRRPTTVDAIRFDGTEQSAKDVIAWAKTAAPDLDVHRVMHPGSWNDQHPELRLNAGDWVVVSGDWIVTADGALLEVDAPDRFKDLYEPADTTP